MTSKKSMYLCILIKKQHSDLVSELGDSGSIGENLQEESQIGIMTPYHNLFTESDEDSIVQRLENIHTKILL